MRMVGDKGVVGRVRRVWREEWRKVGEWRSLRRKIMSRWLSSVFTKVEKFGMEVFWESSGSAVG